MAKFLAANPLVPRVFTWLASGRAAVEPLVGDSGSRLDAQDVKLYARLVRNPARVATVLTRMSRWDLQALERDCCAWRC